MIAPNREARIRSIARYDPEGDNNVRHQLRKTGMTLMELLESSTRSLPAKRVSNCNKFLSQLTSKLRVALLNRKNELLQQHKIRVLIIKTRHPRVAP